MESPLFITLQDTYPLRVRVDDTERKFDLQIIMETYLDTNQKRIVCSVPFPEGYPENDFFRIVYDTRAEKIIAKLYLVYDTDENSLEILIFYVYSSFSDIKPYVTTEERLQLKGLGVFMLCKVLRYLLSIQEHADPKWLSPETKVILTAQGNQCYDIERYMDYTAEECLDVIKQYPYALYMILSTHLYYMYSELDNLIKTEIAKGTIDRRVKIHTLYKSHPEILYTFIRTHMEEIPDNMIMLRSLVCNIITNQRLIEHHYKRMYHLNVEENLGTEATMSGTVADMLSACDERKIYGKKYRKSKNRRFKSPKV